MVKADTNIKAICCEHDGDNKFCAECINSHIATAYFKDLVTREIRQDMQHDASRGTSRPDDAAAGASEFWCLRYKAFAAAVGLVVQPLDSELAKIVARQLRVGGRTRVEQRELRGEKRKDAYARQERQAV